MALDLIASQDIPVADGGITAPLAVVLREFPTGEWVVHTLNKQTGGYTDGSYFRAERPDRVPAAWAEFSRRITQKYPVMAEKETT